MEIMGSGKHFCFSGHSQKFSHKKLSEKLIVRFNRFLKFLIFLENYPPTSEILGSILSAGWFNDFCISGSA